MSDSNQKFLERLDQLSKNYGGEGDASENLIREFQMHGPAKRADLLTEIDQELSNTTAVAANESSLRSYAKLTRLRQNLDNIHHSFRKVGR